MSASASEIDRGRPSGFILSPHLIADPQWPLVLRPQGSSIRTRSKSTNALLPDPGTGHKFGFLATESAEEPSTRNSMSRKRARIAAVIGAVVLVLTLAASAVNAKGFGSGAMGAEPMIGEIALVAFDFAPRAYMDADGALLPISQHTALFSLYGSVYGGDGKTTFALPKMDPPLAGLKYIVAVQGIYPQRP